MINVALKVPPFAKTIHENYTRTGSFFHSHKLLSKSSKLTLQMEKKQPVCSVKCVSYPYLCWDLGGLSIIGLFDNQFWTDEIPFMLALETHRGRAMQTLYCIFRAANLNGSKYLLSFIWISYDQGKFSLKSRIKPCSTLKSWLHCPSTSLAAPGSVILEGLQFLLNKVYLYSDSSCF